MRCSGSGCSGSGCSGSERRRGARPGLAKRRGQLGEGRPAFRRLAQEALAGRRVPGPALVVGRAGAHLGARGGIAGRRVRRPRAAQLAHLVEQLTHPGTALDGDGEELGEAAVRLQVPADHDRVVRLERLGHAVHERSREAQRVAHLADRRAGPIGDDVADHARVRRAVALVDVRDDLLPARRGEVDVHVRVGGAALVDEALEEELVADGVDARDAEGVGDDRIAGAAAPLGGDAALPAEAHEVPADEEELGQAGPLDDLQLVRHLLEHARRHGVVALPHAVMAELLEVREGRLPAGHREAREAVALELQGDLAASRELAGPCDALQPRGAHERLRGRVTGRQRRQLRAALEGVLGVGPAQVGAVVQVTAVTDGHEHVLQLAIRAQCVVDVVRDDRGQPGLVGQPAPAPRPASRRPAGGGAGAPRGAARRGRRGGPGVPARPRRPPGRRPAGGGRAPRGGSR